MRKKLKLKIIEEFETQADFAQAIKEHESKVSAILRGRRPLSDTDRPKWAEALGLPLDELKKMTADATA